MLRHELLSKPKFEVTPRSIVKRPVECVDAGSVYCPCQLAELGQCIECSLLRGEGECRCHWAGSCILSHSQWGRGKVRQSCKFPILQQWERHEGAIIADVTEKAKLRGFDVEYYHRPIDPHLLDHVHIPALNLLMTTQPDELSTQVIKESFTLQGKNTKRPTGLQDEISENMARYEQTLSLAMQTLAQIKAEHGVLEKYYIDSMDFDGVSKRLAATIDSIARQASVSGQAS